MTGEFSEVRPGQIISSALFNSLVTTLMTRMDDLEGRVEDLEEGAGTGADPVAITGFSPTSQQKVKKDLAILGRGFIFPPTESGLPTNTVLINGFQITAFLSDSAVDRLSFNLPQELNITTTTNVTVEVSNELGDAKPWTYTLQPPDPVTVPQPAVTGASPLSSPSLANTVRIGEVAVIVGSNFLTDATKLAVSFSVLLGPGLPLHVYPVPQSGITAVDDMHVQAMVPDMTEVPPTGNRSVIVSVLCEGNPTPGTKTIQARRS